MPITYSATVSCATFIVALTVLCHYSQDTSLIHSVGPVPGIWQGTRNIC